MKKLIWLASLMLLTGCAATSQPRPQPSAKAPAGLVKILADDQLTSYIDYRVISTYQGNSHLRRFYLINNYAERTLIIKEPPVYVSSSRAIDVINCDKKPASHPGSQPVFQTVRGRRACPCRSGARAVEDLPKRLSDGDSC
ncbi:surface-adhesin E family protein [Pantoea tagorei]